MLYIADKGYIWIMAECMHAQCVKDNIPKNIYKCEAVGVRVRHHHNSLGLSKALLPG